MYVYIYVCIVIDRQIEGSMDALVDLYDMYVHIFQDGCMHPMRLPNCSSNKSRFSLNNPSMPYAHEPPFLIQEFIPSSPVPLFGF